jgi:alanine racemase
VATPAGPRRVLTIEPGSTLVETWSEAAPGDTVIVWGRGGVASATDLAELIDTIGEEIALRVSPLVPRRYTTNGPLRAR